MTFPFDAGREVLEDAQANGVRLTAAPEGKLRWECPGSLPEGLLAKLVEHRPAVLAWIIINDAMAIREARDWSEDAALAHQQMAAMDAIDERYVAGDLDGLRAAVPRFVELMKTDAAYPKSNPTR